MMKYIALHKAIERNDIKESAKLIKKGKYLNLQDIEGKTPLHIALETKNFELANMLLKRGVLLNLMDSSKKTPLHIAVAVNDNIAKKIIEMGAKINIQDDFGETPLQTAIRLEKIELAKILIDKGANYYLKDEDNEDAIQLAKRRGYNEIIEQIRQNEAKKMKEKDLKLNKYFNKLKSDIDIASKLEAPNESILEYLKIKLGYEVENITNDSIVNDIIKLYMYNKEKVNKKSEPIENKKEISQWDIDKIIWRKPVYIRGICGVSKIKDTLKLKKGNKIVSLDFKKVKRNETGIELEIRKLKRRKGKPTLTKVEGTKNGNKKRCFSMINFGRIVPLYNLGYGTFGQREDKIDFVAKEDVGSFVDKEQDIVKIHRQSHRMHKNKGINHDLKKLVTYLRKNKRKTNNNEVMMDATDKDVKFIYYFSSRKRKDYHKLKAAYLRRKFEISTGRTLPIFKYRLGKIRCLKMAKLDEKEVLRLLEREITNNKDAYKDELDLLLVFKDEIKSMPKVEKIVKDIVFKSMNNEKNNIYDVINVSKLVGEYFGKSQKKEYLDSHLKPKLYEENMNNFIKDITRNSTLYKHRRKNRDIDFKFEVLSECKMQYLKI